MKKLLSIIIALMPILLNTAVTPKVIEPKTATAGQITKTVGITAFKPVIPTIYIHNLGNQPLPLNSISFSFSINEKIKEEPVPYKITIKPNKIKKISNTKITFNLPETSQVFNSGISQINIGNNQNIKLSSPTQTNIYLTNKSGIWKETTKPQPSTTKAKTITPKLGPDAKEITPAAKTSTLKSTAVAVKAKAKMMPAKSNSAKAVQSTIIATKPKGSVISADVAKK